MHEDMIALLKVMEERTVTMQINIKAGNTEGVVQEGVKLSGNMNELAQKIERAIS